MHHNHVHWKKSVMLAATKRQVSFLATWYRVSQTTHYFKQTCKLSISPLFITNMTCAFQRFYGKQRMLSKNVRIFHSPTIHKGTKRHNGQYTALPIFYYIIFLQQECKSPVRLRSIYLDPCRRSWSPSLVPGHLSSCAWAVVPDRQPWLHSPTAKNNRFLNIVQ